MCNRAVKVLMAKTQRKQFTVFSGLQLFAEGGSSPGGGDPEGGGSDGGDPEGGSSPGGGDPEGGDDGGQQSFDDFLNQEGNKEEFDKRVQAAVDAAVKSAKSKWKSVTDDKVSEAEKLAKMTKEERAEYLQQKAREEFETEKAAFEREKLLVEVQKELQTQNLPLVFAESLVNISDAEKIKKAISEIKKAWDAEIAEAVKAKARQSTPTEGGRVIDGRRGLSSIRKMASENRIIKN